MQCCRGKESLAKFLARCSLKGFSTMSRCYNTHREYKWSFLTRQPACPLRRHRGPLLIPSGICSEKRSVDHENSDPGVLSFPYSTLTKLKLSKQTLWRTERNAERQVMEVKRGEAVITDKKAECALWPLRPPYCVYRSGHLISFVQPPLHINLANFDTPFQFGDIVCSVKYSG